jgi:hypothetical protein
VAPEAVGSSPITHPSKFQRLAEKLASFLFACVFFQLYFPPFNSSPLPANEKGPDFSEPAKNYAPDAIETTVKMGTTEDEGLNIFYREAGKPGRPKLVLLHGFPASSHQYRNFIPALTDKFHVIAMDYPGFGSSDMPDPAKYPYPFDKTSEVVETFLKMINFTRFGLFVQDYGGPVGFRILSRNPTGWSG